MVYLGQLVEVFWGSRAAGSGPGAARWEPVLVAAPILGEATGWELGASFRF